MNNSDIIDELIEIKSIKNLTNYQIAKKSNLPPTTVANIFNKKSAPQLDTLIAICNSFGMSLTFLSNNEKRLNLTESERHILKL